MKKLIILVCLVVSLFCVTELAHSAPFTVDSRSLLHTGASWGIAHGCSTLIVAAGGLRDETSTRNRRIFCAVSSAMVGVVKEFAMDDFHDNGDLFFDAVGYGPMFWMSDSLLFSVQSSGDKTLVSVHGKF